MAQSPWVRRRLVNLVGNVKQASRQGPADDRGSSHGFQTRTQANQTREDFSDPGPLGMHFVRVQLLRLGRPGLGAQQP